MKKQLFLLFIIFFKINSNAQIVFEKGYIINNANEKIDCLIKNVEWRNNPTKFEYKLTENSKKQVGTLQSIKEFSIDNTSKYIKRRIKIDKSSEKIDELTYDRAPTFEEETLFLKVLIEGEANLYSYTRGNLNRFFYSYKNTAIEQLIYKVYLRSSSNTAYDKGYKISSKKITYNKSYKQQLRDDLKCSSVTFVQIENTDYKKQNLVDLFISYNECKNIALVNFAIEQKRNLFQLNLRPGIRYSFLSIENNAFTSRNLDFEKQLGLRIGLEFEFILPFNKNKWAVIIEPTYQSYKKEQEATYWTAAVDYKSIEFPLALRHYFFLNDKSKFFIDAGYALDLSLNSSIDFSPGPDLEISTLNNFVFGIGYKYNNKFSMQIRSQSNRNVLNYYVLWNSGYRTISIVFGYSIF